MRQQVWRRRWMWWLEIVWNCIMFLTGNAFRKICICQIVVIYCIVHSANARINRRIILKALNRLWWLLLRRCRFPPKKMAKVFWQISKKIWQINQNLRPKKIQKKIQKKNQKSRGKVFQKRLRKINHNNSNNNSVRRSKKVVIKNSQMS